MAPRDEEIQPSGPQTQCATGTYTSSAHSGTKTSHAANFVRSAIAPLINAVVRIAKVSWKVVKRRVGTVPVSVLGPMPAMPRWSTPPMRPANASSPNASE